jgi:hypothetical protein
VLAAWRRWADDLDGAAIGAGHFLAEDRRGRRRRPMSDAATGTPKSRDTPAGTLKRIELQHQPSSIPGREIVQVLKDRPTSTLPTFTDGPPTPTSRLGARSALPTPITRPEEHHDFHP